ncbi:MAG: hypothetical protein ACKOPG_09360 [Novosphingobium sp.]
MKTISKALVGTVAAGAMAISSATPAFADNYGRHDRDGISAGDIIAGALVIGGIAAIATAASKNNRDYRYGDYRDGDYRYDRAGYNNGYGYGNGYGYRDNPRQAVEQCVYAAERYAQQRYGRADVTDIRQVKDTRYGFEVKGRIAVNTNGRDWRRGDNNYGNGWGGDFRGWNNGMRGYDSGSFKCRYERGRVVDLDIDGVRGF